MGAQQAMAIHEFEGSGVGARPGQLEHLRSRPCDDVRDSWKVSHGDVGGIGVDPGNARQDGARR